MNFDPVTTASTSPALPYSRPSIGKRGSFVGTVRAGLTLPESSLIMILLIRSPVGWHLSL